MYYNILPPQWVYSTNSPNILLWYFYVVVLHSSRYLQPFTFKINCWEPLLLCAQVSGPRLLSLRPPGPSDPASKSTSCQQHRPRSSRRSRRRRRRTPLLRTPGNQETGAGGGGASPGWESGLKSRPPRSLMPSQPARGRWGSSHCGNRKKTRKDNNVHQNLWGDGRVHTTTVKCEWINSQSEFY